MFALLAVFALAQAASPTTPLAPPPASAVAPAAAAKPVKICREGQRNLGSHMRSGRVCRTAEEWAAQKSDGKVIPSMTIRRSQDAVIEGLPRPTCC
ncbi:MAG: hypothetical protein ABIO29_03765 [Sphingomicrobium sp.]